MAIGATTPPADEGKATPEAEKGAITPEKKPAGETTPPDEVAELKGQVEDLEKKLEIATSLQSQADRKARAEAIARKKVEIQLAKAKKGETFVEPENTEGESADEKEIKLEAKIGIKDLLLENPSYQEILAEDITLREVLKNNPFALIGDFLDAEDAVGQIKEVLEAKVQAKKSQPPVNNEEDKGKGKVFEPGPINPPSPPLPPKPAGEKVGVDKTEESIRGKITVTE